MTWKIIFWICFYGRAIS